MAAALFARHKSNPLGDYLKEKRLDQGKTFRKASQDLNIPIKYLEALENNEPEHMPGPEYFERYLLAYIGYLKINPAQIGLLKSKSESAKQMKDISKQARVAWTEYWSRAAIAIVVMMLAIFLGLKVNAIFMPPELRIVSPEDGLITVSRQLEVKGVSTPEAEIIINNKAVFVDQAGNFSTFVDLQKGLNLIKITAKKRYSRTSEAEIRVLFKE